MVVSTIIQFESINCDNTKFFSVTYDNFIGCENGDSSTVEVKSVTVAVLSSVQIADTKTDGNLQF